MQRAFTWNSPTLIPGVRRIAVRRQRTIIGSKAIFTPCATWSPGSGRGAGYTVGLGFLHVFLKATNSVWTFRPFRSNNDYRGFTPLKTWCSRRIRRAPCQLRPPTKIRRTLSLRLPRRVPRGVSFILSGSVALHLGPRADPQERPLDHPAL